MTPVVDIKPSKRSNPNFDLNSLLIAKFFDGDTFI